MLRIALLLLLPLLAVSLDAPAAAHGYTFTLTPTAPRSAEPLQLIVSVGPTPCTPLPETLEQRREGDVVRITLVSSDGCPPNVPPQTRVYTLGQYGPGRYTFEFALCFGLPPPGTGDECSVRETQTLVVSASASDPRPIPSTGSIALLGMIVSMVLIAARRRT